MDVLHIDIETYSSADLAKTTVYRYCESDDFAVLLFGYAVDDGPVHVVDLAQGEEIPDDIIRAIIDPEVIKTAFNANFERVCLTKYFDWPMWHPPSQWHCTQIQSLHWGLPSSLGKAAEAAGIEQNKDQSGQRLIRYFSKPCKATKANGGRTRNRPEHDPEAWEQFKDYCRQDVEVERALDKRLSCVRQPWWEWKLYHIDQDINDLGVRIDKDLVNASIRIDNTLRKTMMAELKEITGLDNPNSQEQLRGWLADNGALLPNLQKATVADAMASTDNETIRQVLTLRQRLSKSSTAKYKAAKQTWCRDERARGLFQHYGASRTGRWAGRQIQLQNLPQNHLSDLETSRELVKQGDAETLSLLYDSVQDTLSQLTRTMIVPSPHRLFVVSDFSSIEARVIAWLAREEWKLDVFRSHGKVYEAAASRMYKIPLESITKESPERQKGKVAELACGFGGGVKALEAMDSSGRIPKAEMQAIVDQWRAANPKICALWKDVERAAIAAVQSKQPQTVNSKVQYHVKHNVLWATLPSGRMLAYPRPEIGEGRFGQPALTFEGVNGVTKKWERMETWGGTLVENLVQGIARDCLANALFAVERFYPIVLHVHDELVAEVPEGHEEDGLQRVVEAMRQPIEWAEGLPMDADGYITPFYRKD